MKTNVYVDAFNLYYGSLKGTSYRWLDLSQFCQASLPNNQIQHIRYFTARESNELKKAASKTYVVDVTHLAASQFPNLITSSSGKITKPIGW